MVSGNENRKWSLDVDDAQSITSSTQLSHRHTAEKGHVIKARRSEDGAVTFDLSVSHIIEQVVQLNQLFLPPHTLLRALNRPNFRKSTIKVIDDVDQSDSEEETSPDETLVKRESPEDVQQLVPVGQQMVEYDKSANVLSEEGSIVLKQTTWNDNSPSSRPDKETINPIPKSWLQRGLTSDERRQFQQSIANASICPYQRQRKVPVKYKNDKLHQLVNAMSTPAINWPAHSISTTSSPSHGHIKLEPRDVTDIAAETARAAYSSSYPPYATELDRPNEEFYRLPTNHDLNSSTSNSFDFDSRYDENVIHALTDDVIQEEMNSGLSSYSDKYY